MAGSIHDAITMYKYLLSSFQCIIIALRNIILETIDRMANQHLQIIYVPDSSACGRSFDRLSQVVLENIKVLNVK